MQNHLKAHADKGETEPVTYRKLNPSHTKPPYLYGLPKIKKNPDCPLRPIVCTVGFLTYTLAKHLAQTHLSFSRKDILPHS